ncbi:hypothetical protein ACA910_016948 [Epithemia clementina (nom. ined.)]
MSSTFRRPGDKARLSLPGTKHWAGGITLTSTGLRDLDNILGSGQPLGTCIWLDEDRWTRSLAMALVKYWCAEAVSQNQRLLIPVNVDEDEKASKKCSTSCFDSDDDELLPYFSDCSGVEHILRLLKSLPRNLHLDKAHKGSTQGDHQTAVALDTVGEEGSEDEHDESLANEATSTDDEGLKIAWQYRKSVQRERLGQSSQTTKEPAATTSSQLQHRKRPSAADVTQEFCHSYDLQGKLSDQIDLMSKTTLLEHCCNSGTSSDRSCAFELYLVTKARLQNMLQEGPSGVVRVLFYRTHLSVLSVVLPLLLSFVREHELPVVFMVACRPWSSPPGPKNHNNNTRNLLTGLKRASDVVLEVEGFASRQEYPPPSEFRMFHGLLKIRKCSTLTAATANGRGGHFADMTSSRQVPADLYGLKRDRRKLHIQMLHIPPEDFVEGGSVGSGAVRSGAGRPNKDSSSSLSSKGLGCASSGGALDF